MRRSIISLLLCSLLYPMTDADACQPIPEEWMFRDLVSMVGSESGDKVLILRGSMQIPLTLAEIQEQVRVDVTRDGESVEGELEMGLVRGHLIWRPTENIEADVEYEAVVVTELQWSEEGYATESVSVQWATEGSDEASIEITDAFAEAWERTLFGECLEDGLMDSCGGCEREVLGHEGRWRAQVELLDNGADSGHFIGRIAVAADADEAEAILARTGRVQLRFNDGRTNLGVDGGLLARWPSKEGCVAVEIAHPDGAVILNTVECVTVPGADPDALLQPPTPSEPGLDSEATGMGGCNAAPNGAGESTVALFGLLLLLGRRGAGRRLVALFSLLVAMVASGCTTMEEASPVEGPDPACGSETSVPCAESRGRILPRLETAEVPPVPVSGGTLTTGATWTVAADSDRGQVSVVRTADGALVATIEMGGEPGRVLIDTDEAFAYVTDRVGAEVVEIDLPAGKIARRLPVCQSPRGLDIGPEGSLLVACRTGTFQRIERATGEVLASTWLGDDLRDVVVNQGRVFVTRFRAAELLEVDASGAVISRRSPPTLANGTEFKPTASNTAWRTIALPDGRMVMLHQRAQLSAVGIASEGGYGRHVDSLCGESIVQPTVTVFDADGPGRHLGIIPAATLAVDVAHDEATGRLILAAAGKSQPHADAVHFGVLSIALDPAPGEGAPTGPCSPVEQANRPWLKNVEVTAVAMDPAGRVMIFDRLGGALRNGTNEEKTALSDVSVFDTGHDLFHKDAGAGLACASCHPEGRDDGHTWLFADLGLRRTQTLGGGLKGTEPFHWEGDMPDFGTLTREVMGERMRGPKLDQAYSGAMLDWLDTVPAPAAAGEDADAVARGRALFEDAVVGCAGCHSGAALTDNRSYDVGTGGILQVPSLRGIASRAPFMHDGCASVLEERFTDCGGGDEHGRTSHLDGDQIADLVSYMNAL